MAHTADWVPMEAGDRICFDYGGGGGCGDPLDRQAGAVLDDVLDEYVSVAGAERDYGVKITCSKRSDERVSLPGHYTLDLEATQGLRGAVGRPANPT